MAAGQCGSDPGQDPHTTLPMSSKQSQEIGTSKSPSTSSCPTASLYVAPCCHLQGRVRKATYF